MPDTLTAADASARPHAAPPPSVIPAMAGDVAAPQDGPAPTKPAALFRAATDLLPVLEAGQALDAATLRRAMSTAFGASDTRRRLGMEGRLRGRRGGAGPVPPALRPPHAPRGGRRTRWSRRHARHAGDARRPGAVPDPAFRRATRTPAVLDAHCRWPTRRCRPPLSGRAIPCSNPRPAPACWPSWLQCALGDRTAGALHLNELAGCPRRASHPVVSGYAGDPAQRRGHRRPSARHRAQRGADEPAVFGLARRQPHSP